MKKKAFTDGVPAAEAEEEHRNMMHFRVPRRRLLREVSSKLHEVFSPSLRTTSVVSSREATSKGLNVTDSSLVRLKVD